MTDVPSAAALAQGSGLVQGAVAVVTGASSGNGRAIAERFAQEGATAVVVADLREDPREGGPATTELVERAGAQAAFVRTDVSSVGDLRNAVAAADAWGGVTVMVNNAGIFRSEEFLDVTEEAYDQLMDVNVKGTYFGAQAAARSMVEGGRSGSIVNLSSIAGLRGSGYSPTYNTSKGGVRLLTMSLAESLGQRGIRVNAIHPGLITTAMGNEDVPHDPDEYVRTVPLGRLGTAVDVADAAVWLASDLASWVNGTSVTVDGGGLRI